MWSARDSWDLNLNQLREQYDGYITVLFYFFRRENKSFSLEAHPALPLWPSLLLRVLGPFIREGSRSPCQ